MVFHSAQCLGQSCSSCIQLTWSHSSSSTACRRTSTLTTLRFMVQVVHLMSAPCCKRLPDVWQLLQIGFRPNRLQLNCDKTVFMWLTSPRSQHRLPTSSPLIGSNVVSPSATVRDLGFFIDQDLRMKTHVQQTASVVKHPSLHTDVRLTFPCFRTRPQQVGLLQQSPDRLASHSHPTSPVSPKCRSKAHFQPETLWPHHQHAHQPSLAPRARANYIHAGDADV